VPRPSQFVGFSMRSRENGWTSRIWVDTLCLNQNVLGLFVHDLGPNWFFYRITSSRIRKAVTLDHWREEEEDMIDLLELASIQCYCREWSRFRAVGRTSPFKTRVRKPRVLAAACSCCCIFCDGEEGGQSRVSGCQWPGRVKTKKADIQQ
jgi:hypothetical protein